MWQSILILPDQHITCMSNLKNQTCLILCCKMVVYILLFKTEYALDVNTILVHDKVRQL